MLDVRKARRLAGLTMLVLGVGSVVVGSSAAKPHDTLWASPSGGGTACSAPSPCTLAYAVANASAGATVRAKSGTYTFDVQPTSGVAKVGEPAPSVKTPTLSAAGGDPSKIATDPSPDPAFYQTSIDQALADHKPFVVVFATPKFCVSAQCGPTLDRIKPYAARYPSVAFINVEPYKLKLEGGTLQADLDAQGNLAYAVDFRAYYALLLEAQRALAVPAVEALEARSREAVGPESVFVRSRLATTGAGVAFIDRLILQFTDEMRRRYQRPGEG